MYAAIRMSADSSGCSAGHSTSPIVIVAVNFCNATVPAVIELQAIPEVICSLGTQDLLQNKPGPTITSRCRLSIHLLPYKWMLLRAQSNCLQLAQPRVLTRQSTQGNITEEDTTGMANV